MFSSWFCFILGDEQADTAIAKTHMNLKSNFDIARGPVTQIFVGVMTQRFLLSLGR